MTEEIHWGKGAELDHGAARATLAMDPERDRTYAPSEHVICADYGYIEVTNSWPHYVNTLDEEELGPICPSVWETIPLPWLRMWLWRTRGYLGHVWRALRGKA